MSNIQSLFDNHFEINKMEVEPASVSETERAGRLGGSDVAAIMGRNYFKSPLEVYLAYKGEGLVIEDNAAIKWGRVLEPVMLNNLPYIAQQYDCDITETLSKSTGFVRKDMPYLIGHPDGYCIHKGEFCGLEIKTGNPYSTDEWEDNSVPQYYEIQCQTYMLITNIKKWVIAGMISGRVYIREIEANERLHDNIRKQVADFYNEHLLKDVMPEASGTKNEVEHLKQMVKPEKLVIRDENIAGLVEQLEQARKDKRDAQQYENKKTSDILQWVLSQQTGIRIPCVLDVDSTSGSSYQLTISEVTANRFNTTDFKESNIELYNKYVKPSSYKTIRTKQIK